MERLSLPSEHIIKTHVEEIYVRGLESGKTKVEFHKFLQENIAALAYKFYLTPEKEFVVADFRRSGYSGHIDVVWAVGSIPVVAIEIDSALREKSVKKLLASNANLLFWVYYGNKPFEPFVSSIDIAGRVKILHLTSKYGEVSVRPRNVIPVKQELTPSKSYSYADVRKKYPHAYEIWSNEEDEMLIKSIKVGMTISEIVNMFQRKPGAIRSRIKKLGLK